MKGTIKEVRQLVSGYQGPGSGGHWNKTYAFIGYYGIVLAFRKACSC